MALGKVTEVGLEEVDVFLKLGEDLFGGQDRKPPGCQLDGEGHSMKEATDFLHVLELASIERSSALNE
jgi:hypothetical protein